MIVSCASKTRCNEIIATINPLLESESGSPLDILCLDHSIEHVSDLTHLYSGGENAETGKKSLAFDILVTTTSNLLFLLQNKCFKGMQVVVTSLVIDKVDLHLATDLDEELITVGKELQNFLTNSDSEKKSKIVLTTNEQDKEGGFEKVKSAFLDERKAVIIKLKEQTKSTSRYESIGHLVIGCDSEVQKYLIFYTL
jgi:hypothetical protein